MRKVLLAAALLGSLGLMAGSSFATDTTTVYLIQQGVYPINTPVFVDSVIVTAVDLKPTTFGFHIQERGGGPYSGILYYTRYVRPDTIGGVGVQVGDLVRVWGTYDEYNNHSEITMGSDGHVEIIQKGYGAPPCTLLSCGDLGYSPYDASFAEKWEGVLICVDTVQVVDIGDYAEWTVVEYHDHPGIGLGDSLRIDDKLFDPTLSPPDSGDTLAFIRGVYAEEWGNYRLWPRDYDDLIFMGPEPGPHLLLAYATSETTINAVFDRDLDETSAEDINNYSLATGTTIQQAILNVGNPKVVKLITDPQPTDELETLTACDIKSAGGTRMYGCESYDFMAGITPISSIQTAPDTNDASPLEGLEVTVRGIVTGPSSSFGGPFFMQDAPGQWNGIFVYDPTASFDLGDSVVIAGVVGEHYGLTEIFSVDYAKEDADQVRIPQPTVTTCPACLAAAESYEGVLVTLDSVEVFTYFDQYGEWTVGVGTDTCKIGDYAIERGPGYSYPGLGSLAAITGCYRYNYGEFKLEPRFDADIVVIDSVTAGITDAARRLSLSQNSPNPFIGKTSIRLNIAARTKAKLAVYDVSGRLVRTLTEGVLEPGEYRYLWDGRDDANRRVSPGIYFYRLTTPDGSLQKKMVILQ